MIPQVHGFQGCYLDNHRNNWGCARAVPALCENAPYGPLSDTQQPFCPENSLQHGPSNASSQSHFKAACSMRKRLRSGAKDCEAKGREKECGEKANLTPEAHARCPGASSVVVVVSLPCMRGHIQDGSVFSNAIHVNLFSFFLLFGKVSNKEQTTEQTRLSTQQLVVTGPLAQAKHSGGTRCLQTRGLRCLRV